MRHDEACPRCGYSPAEDGQVISFARAVTIDRVGESLIDPPIGLPAGTYLMKASVTGRVEFTPTRYSGIA